MLHERLLLHVQTLRTAFVFTIDIDDDACRCYALLSSCAVGDGSELGLLPLLRIQMPDVVVHDGLDDALQSVRLVSAALLEVKRSINWQRRAGVLLLSALRCWTLGPEYCALPGIAPASVMLLSAALC
jgi:hypothetical protein